MSRFGSGEQISEQLHLDPPNVRPILNEFLIGASGAPHNAIFYFSVICWEERIDRLSEQYVARNDQSKRRPAGAILDARNAARFAANNKSKLLLSEPATLSMRPQITSYTRHHNCVLPASVETATQLRWSRRMDSEKRWGKLPTRQVFSV